MNSFLRTVFAVSCLVCACSVSQAQALAPESRLMLTRSAAERSGLGEVGLDFRDLYGVIHAESSWVARDGMGKNGVVSRGLAQFEPATAKAVGLRNPDDPVASVHAAARLLKEAAVWSSARIEKLGLTAQQRAAKLREGVSVYYNLSTRGRAQWNGLNTHQLPVETQTHIRNVRTGVLEADRLSAQLGGARPSPPAWTDAVAAGPVRASSRAAAPTRKAETAKPQPLGTIEWAGSAADGQGRRRYVLWSNGTIERQPAS